MPLGDAISDYSTNWAVLFPVVTGFLAVWYLLPSPRRRLLAIAALGVVVAVAGFGVFLFEGLGGKFPGSPEAILFTAFGLLAFTFAILMIVQRNPARSALFFAVVVLNVCGLFLLLAAPFLMGATIIIYAGAIIVTFLFVIMLSQQTRQTDADDRSREPSLAAAVGFVLLGALLVVLQRTWWTHDVDELIRQSDRYANSEIPLKEPAEAERYLADVTRVRARLGYGSIKIPTGEEHASDSDAVEEMRDALGLNLPAFPPPAGKMRRPPARMDEVRKAGAQIRYELSYLKAVREGRIKPEIADVILSPHGLALPVATDEDPALAQPRRLPEQQYRRPWPDAVYRSFARRRTGGNAAADCHHW